MYGGNNKSGQVGTGRKQNKCISIPTLIGLQTYFENTVKYII